MGDANRSGGGNSGDVDEADELGSIGPRRPGSEAERRMARQLEKRLQELGREADLEPTRIRPNFAVTHLIHAVAGVIASVLSVYAAGPGLALALVTSVSAFGDLSGSFHLVRALTPARASQNVVSDEDNGKPGLIVLAAHYDSRQTGMLLLPRLKWWPKALVGSLTLITVCAAGRLAGLDQTWFTVIQFLPTVVLIVMTPLFADIALSPPSEADNTAGVSSALQLAESHSDRLRYFDLMVVFTGASAHFALGMQAWLRRHHNELNPAATAVICLDTLDSGEHGYAAKEGPFFATRMHPTLVEIARDSGAEAFTSSEMSDAYAARAVGVPALRLSGNADDLTAQILERIDEEIGPLLDSRSD